MKPMMFLSIILAVLIQVYSPLYGQITDDGEIRALIALYRSTGGARWTNNSNWTKVEKGIENWYGIELDENKSTVVKIDLRTNQLTGPLPPELGNLKNLRTLLLRFNKLTTLPPQLANLTNLKELDLGFNRLQGKIPGWIGRLKKLKTLRLDDNEFTGTIPENLGNLTKLTHLSLNSNRLTGNIPGELEKLSQLEILYLHSNRLTGPIPAWLGNLTRLEELKLGLNRLSGSIPGELGNPPKKNLRVIELDRNQLIGPIPGKLASLELEDHKSDFRWNGLYTNDTGLKEFLNQKQKKGDWEDTQTIAPEQLSVADSDYTSITIKWKSIAYSDDSGGYRVYYRRKGEKKYKLAGITDDKTTSHLLVKGLNPKTTYYFAIETWTHRPGNSQYEIVSKISGKIEAATRGTTISGRVSLAGKGLEKVEMIANPGAISKITDAKGKYSFNVREGWSGKVTPIKNGYQFDPGSCTYEPVNEDYPNGDYKAQSKRKISGIITESGDNRDEPVPGVTLTFKEADGTLTSSTTTDPMGSYSYIVSPGWTGTVTPAKEGYIFEPLKKSYNKEFYSAQPGENYSALRPKISGRVRDKMGHPIAGVILTFSNQEEILKTETKHDGSYSKKVPYKWTGKIKPSHRDYTFDRPGREYSNVIADKTGENFKASLDLKFFVSIGGNYMLPAQENFKDIYGSGLLDPEIRIGYRLHRNFHVWGGFGFSSKTGASPTLKERTKWQEKCLSLGLSYNGSISARIDYKASLGAIYISYSEEALGETPSGNAFGVRIDGSGIFNISNRWFTEILMGYLLASDTINDISLKLGGFKTGIGLGVRF